MKKYFFNFLFLGTIGSWKFFKKSKWYFETGIFSW